VQVSSALTTYAEHQHLSGVSVGPAVGVIVGVSVGIGVGDGVNVMVGVGVLVANIALNGLFAPATTITIMRIPAAPGHPPELQGKKAASFADVFIFIDHTCRWTFIAHNNPYPFRIFLLKKFMILLEISVQVEGSTLPLIQYHT